MGSRREAGFDAGTFFIAIFSVGRRWRLTSVSAGQRAIAAPSTLGVAVLLETAARRSACRERTCQSEMKGRPRMNDRAITR